MRVKESAAKWKERRQVYRERKIDRKKYAKYMKWKKKTWKN